MKTVEQHGNELAKDRPEHAAVAELTRKEQAYVSKLREVCQWDKSVGSETCLSCAQKSLLLSAVGCFLTAGFITCVDFVLQDKYCFRSFAITSSIGDDTDLGGLDGNALNLVMPCGWVALGLAFIGFILNYIFGKWTASVAKKKLQISVTPSGED